MKLVNPKTGETYDSVFNMNRLTPSLQISQPDILPEEELAEMFEGLLIGHNKELDLTKEEDWNYAKTRWLQAHKKLFTLLSNVAKRADSTYGTLPNDLPLPCFFNSLGSGRGQYGSRMFFTQDLSQTIDDKSCVVDGQKMSPAQVLLKEGMITQEEIDEATQINGDYYQTLHYNITGYSCGDPVMLIQKTDKDNHFQQNQVE